MAIATTMEMPNPAVVPSTMASQPGPICRNAIAAPYAPKPKNMVWAKLTIPV